MRRDLVKNLSIGSIAAIAFAFTAQNSKAEVKWGIDKPPPPPPVIGEPLPSPPTEPVDNNVDQLAVPQTLEQQVADLQKAVSELQGEIEKMEGDVDRLKPDAGDFYISAHHPTPSIVCSGLGLTSPNDILVHVHQHLGQDAYSEYPMGTFLVTWTGCTSR